MPCSEKARVESTKLTNIERYGVANVFQDPTIKAKALKTLGENWGVQHPMESEELKQRQKETLYSNYGVTSPMQSDEIQNRVKKTNVDRYGVEHIFQSEETKAKIRETNLERYGVPAPLMNEEVKSKAKKTSLKRYGTERPIQSEEVQARVNASNTERYGAAWTLSTDAVREKSKATNLAKRGVMWPTQDPEVRDKIRKTNLDRYGVENVFQAPEFITKAKLTYAKNLLAGAHDGHRKVSKLNRALAEAIAEEFRLELTALTFEAPLGSRQFDLGIGDLLIDLNPTVSHNMARPFRCAVTGCAPGCADHTAIPSSYHFERASAAQAAGLSLVQLYDWDSRESTIRLLAGRLERGWIKHSARKLTLAKISSTTANKFLASNHIQGGVRGQTHCYGLMQGAELLAVATFGKSRFGAKAGWEFLRYAVQRGYLIRGGVDRFWRAFQRDAQPNSVISYVSYDHTTAPLIFLHRLGFQEMKPTGPSVAWSKGTNRIYNNSLLSQGADRLLGTNYGRPEVCGMRNDEIMLTDGWLPVSTSGNRVFLWAA